MLTRKKGEMRCDQLLPGGRTVGTPFLSMYLYLTLPIDRSLSEMPISGGKGACIAETCPETLSVLTRCVLLSPGRVLGKPLPGAVWLIEQFSSLRFRSLSTLVERLTHSPPLELLVWSACMANNCPWSLCGSSSATRSSPAVGRKPSGRASVRLGKPLQRC